MNGILKSFKAMIREIPRQRKKPLDKSVVVVVVLISVFGIIMIWSASMYNAKMQGNEYYYVLKQAKYLALGLVMMYFVSLLDYKYLRDFSTLALILTILLLTVVAFMPAEGAVKGAVRSISIFGIVIMPAEIAKIAVLLFMADQADKNMDNIQSFKTFIIVMVFCVILFYLIKEQPALSTAIIIGVLILAMYFLSGGNILYISVSAVLAGFAVYYYITSSDWRMGRIAGYLDPFANLLDEGWQPAQSLMALGSGGIFGQGIGNGRAKLNFLPEPQNDYIFAIIGEELGFIGCCALIFAYFILIFKIIKIAMTSPDIFSRMYASGMAVLLAVQVFLNIAVVTNLMPSTGIILPFVSSGGSSLVTLLLGMGVVLNISRNRKRTVRVS